MYILLYVDMYMNCDLQTCHYFNCSSCNRYFYCIHYLCCYVWNKNYLCHL